MRKDSAEIVFVLDMTGSMEPLKMDAIGGFNQFLNDQKKVPGEAKITLVLFNSTEVKNLYDGKDIHHIAELTENEYRPSSMTPLMDVLAQTIDDLGRKLSAKPEQDRPEKVIFVILTDGEENYSKKYSRKDVFDRIRHQQEHYGWQFIFLGSNQDSFKEAGMIGIPTVNTSNYTATGSGVRSAYNTISSLVTDYRTGS